MTYKILGLILIVDSLLRFRHYFRSHSGYLFLIALGEMMLGYSLLLGVHSSSEYYFVSISIFLIGLCGHEFSLRTKDRKKTENLKPFLGIIPVFRTGRTTRGESFPTGKMGRIISGLISVVAGVVIFSSEGLELYSLPFIAALLFWGMFTLFRCRKDT
ncbi:hypothetical protein KAI78_00510 [bacterium]|nr:hypothetical protein [bacterium]